MEIRIGSWIASLLVAVACAAAPAGAEPTAPTKVSAGPDGFALRSADGAFQLELRGYVQVDGRFFLDDEEQPASDSLLVRRARPLLEGTLCEFLDFRIMPDFGSGASSLQDAYLEARFAPAVRLRVGKFKPPVGLPGFVLSPAPAGGMGP